MKRLNQFKRSYSFAAGVLALTLIAGSRGGTISTDFNSGPPDDAVFLGSAYWDWIGGVGDSGVIKLTDAVNGQQGVFMLGDLDAGAEITGFTASFKMRLGGGTTPPADGLSFNFANDIPDWMLFGEEGTGTGITISFDTYDNGGGEAPAIDIKNGGVTIASIKGNLDLFHTGDFVPVLVQTHPGGRLDLTVNGVSIVSGLPGAFTKSAGRFAFGARTGGFNDAHWIDDLQITTTSTPPEHPFLVSMSPLGTGAREDGAVQVVVQDGVQHVLPATVQMKFNGAVVPASVNKSGDLTTISYDPPGLMQSGATESVTVTFADDGAGHPSQTISFSFQVRYYLGPTGNIYELITPDFGLTWEDANADAQTRTYHGRPGHLATLTSYDEDVFANKVRTTSGNGFASGWEVWAGGFQTYGSAPKDGWNWVNGEGSFAGINGGATYANWIAGEPNDYYGPDSENYLAIGLNGKFGWNDDGYYGSRLLGGYVIEYESLQITVDIKPGASPNVVNVQDQGKLPVAILSSSTFSAANVDTTTIRFGRTGVEATPVKSTIQDVNGDGRPDLLLTFNVQDIGWRCGDSSALLIAQDKNGVPLKGSDSVQLNGCPVYSLAVTALQDVNHKTDIQLAVSPALPGYTAPTVANQVQLKSYKISGQLGWSRNVASVPLAVSGSSSVGGVSYNDLLRFQKIDAKVNVANSKNKQTEVLRAEGRVLFRPDLAVTSVSAPTQVNTFRVINITAPVSELQADLGATADAALIIDGVVADTINGIKVPAGGQVGLVFTTRFETAAVHACKIRVSNVNPGDYDLSNNEYSFNIEAVQPALTPMYYDAAYSHYESEYQRDWDDDYSSGTEHSLYKDETFNQTLYIDQPLAFPLTSFQVRATVDGVNKIDVSLDDPYSYTYDYGCYKSSYGSANLGGNAYIYVQQDRDDCAGWSYGYIQVQNYAYNQSYFSSGYDKYWGQPFNSSYNYGYGSFFDAANSIETRIVVGAQNGSFGGNGGIPSLDSFLDYQPFDNNWGTGFEKGFYKTLIVSGYNSGMTTP